MPLADTTQAAALTFDAAVHRALSRRLSDTPWPHNGVAAPSPAPMSHGTPLASAVAPVVVETGRIAPPALEPGELEPSAAAG